MKPTTKVHAVDADENAPDDDYLFEEIEYVTVVGPSEVAYQVNKVTTEGKYKEKSMQGCW